MVASIPPQMQPSSCNPVTFDIIKKNIEVPTLDHRLSATVKKLPVQKSKPVENVAVKAPEARPEPEIKTPAVEEPKKVSSAELSIVLAAFCCHSCILISW